jgi:toxin YoeB
MYSVTYSDEALASIAKFKRSNPASFKKITKFIEELHEHPRTGTGHPEPLRGYGEIYEEVVNVFVISAEGHYNDK